MASLKAIRKRIGSVKNTQKITRAMKMVAAARLRRAQQRIVELRPYAQKTREIISSMAARAGDDETVHPLLARRDEKNVLLVVLTSDRGLAGAFNSNANRTGFRFHEKLRAEGKNVSVTGLGRKGRDYFRRRGATFPLDFQGVFENLTIEKAREIGQVIAKEYIEEKFDAVYLVYNEFKSAISQTVRVEQLLPITLDAPVEGAASSDFIYEPSKQALLERLLPMYVDVEIYRALLESVASEHGARMTAMGAATNNASDMISKLTLQFNRARQAAITKELMEIIGGAEALKG